jgi:hypothetical protein
VLDVERWAELRREHFVRGVPIKELVRRTGLARNTGRAPVSRENGRQGRRAVDHGRTARLDAAVHRPLTRTMTGSAVRSVPLDWQGPVSSYAQAWQAAAAVASQPEIQQASATATAPFSAASHTGPAGNTNSGSGQLLAIPPGYLAHIHTFRFLQGSLREGAIVLDQQLAATLQAHIGDIISLTPRNRARPQCYPVSGIALITAPDAPPAGAPTPSAGSCSPAQAGGARRSTAAYS